MDRVLYHVVTIMLVVAASTALAQQMSPAEQALGSRLLSEISASVQCSTNVIVLQMRIAELEKKLVDAKPKEGDAK